MEMICFYNKIVIKYFIQNLTLRKVTEETSESLALRSYYTLMQNMACNYARSNQNINTDMKELLQENDWSMKMKLELLCVERANQKTLLFIPLRCAAKSIIHNC